MLTRQEKKQIQTATKITFTTSLVILLSAIVVGSLVPVEHRQGVGIYSLTLFGIFLSLSMILDEET